MDMSRRRFLGKASQVAAAATVASRVRPVCGEEAVVTIIDTHQHLWDLSRISLTWLRPPLDRSFTPADYAEASRGLHIVQAIYMEVAVPREQRLREAQYVLELCKDPNSITSAAVLAGSPMDEDFESHVLQFKDNPYVKGFRGGLSAGRMLDERTIKNLRWLGTLGMRFDLNVPPSSLAEAACLVEQCPDTRFILDHCGNADPVAFFPAGHVAPRAAQHSPDSWKRDMEALAAKTNVVCKISGLVDNVPDYPLTAGDLAPIVRHCLDAFGPDRVIFASDWPVCLRGMSLRGWVELLRAVTAGHAETDRRKLFHDNAVELYGLPSVPRPYNRPRGNVNKDE